ncbi:hypothetical protein [Arthrobacter sp. StoSoilA2]|nr:hypothetical protein [Arthrobacter sp. StoSoilA2]
MLDEEINETDASLKQFVERTAPTLTSKLAIGPGARRAAVDHRRAEH